MTKIEVKSAQKGVASLWIEVEGVSESNLDYLSSVMKDSLNQENQISDAVAKAFQKSVALCPTANPSDLWQHVVYRNFIDLGHSDQQWKRVSGFALERALAMIYEDKLSTYDMRMRILNRPESRKVIASVGLENTVNTSKVDLFIEGCRDGRWEVFGVIHVKASIAERIQDDVPASTSLMKKGLLSIMLTMDSKSYPPPHGDGVNYGELGGRSFGTKKERIKRDYIEKNGQFDALFSFNLRTPASPRSTESGKMTYDFFRKLD
ncbi:MAG: BsaWI family type II restriction enzyme [Planctomycetes bacterium]|nr:BsaWI family type II restriction enzyme [Planctomycetota bacterium]